MSPLWLYINYEIDKISTMGNYDYIALISSFYSMVNERFNCHKCLSGKARYKKLKEDKRTKLINDARKIKGCFTLTKKPRYTTDYVNYRGCIGRYRVANFDYIMNLYKVYKNSLNPFGGNFIDTPNKVVEICNLIDNLIVEENEEQQGKNGR